MQQTTAKKAAKEERKSFSHLALILYSYAIVNFNDNGGGGSS